MAIKYISTATRGAAHASDVMGVALAGGNVATAGADGFLRVWNNSAFEREQVAELDVDSKGLHHVSVFEDTLPVTGTRVCLLGCVGFSGEFHLVALEGSTLRKLAFNPETPHHGSYWAPCFVRDWERGEAHCLAITTVTGQTQVFSLSFPEGEPEPVFVHRGQLEANDSSFAVSVAAHASSQRLVVGHQNGSVYLYDLVRMMLVFNFETYALQNNAVLAAGGASGAKSVKGARSVNVVRSLAFSPNGQLLAVARDSGPYGTVALHDVKYGEFLGTFTVASHSSNVGVGSYAHKKWCMCLDFNQSGTLLATGGFDNKVRVWDVETRTCEATLQLSATDISDEDLETSTSLDESACVDLMFVAPGVIEGDGKNDALVVVGFDRAVRWFREAGGV